MRGPQLEDGYTRIANEILEAIYQAEFNATQLKILLLVMRYTYGFRRKSHDISLNFIENATGISKRYISSELNKLIDKNVIKIFEEHTNTTSRKIGINKYYKEWEINRKVKVLNNSSTVEEISNTTVEESFNSGMEQSFDTTVEQFSNTTVEQSFYQDKKVVKKDTTTISIESEEEENIKNDSVADIGADPIQQKRESDLQRIENYYLAEVRKKTMCTGNDTMAIIKAYETYKDIDFILGVLESGTKENIARNNGRCSINSFSYFTPIFEERWNALHAKKEEVEVKAKQPSKKYYSGNKVQGKKTRFHNFEQRTSKYTADQLEEIAERKKREHLEKLNKQKEEA